MVYSSRVDICRENSQECSLLMGELGPKPSAFSWCPMRHVTSVTLCDGVKFRETLKGVAI